MAHSFLTTADVANFNKTDMELVINTVLDYTPFLKVLAARTCRGNSFTYSRITANPTVGFRAANAGRENSKATYEKVLHALGILDASFHVDVAVAESDERGVGHAIATEGMAHLRAAFQHVEKQIINGTLNAATDSFDGFADLEYLDHKDDSKVIDAGGTTAGTGSSVYLVKAGDGDVEALWGQNGVIEMGDQSTIEVTDASGKYYPAYYTPISGWCGVKIGSTHSIVRIANLTDDAGKGLTDDLIYEALALFPSGMEPDFIVMGRRSLKQLRASRTATNATGIPAPFPEEVEGVQIIRTDSITETETLLVAAT